MKIGFDYIGITLPFYCIGQSKKLFLHKRSNRCRDEHGRWDNGGGQLEFGESPEEGVLREIKEEYGCSAKILHQYSPITVLRVLDGNTAHWLALPFIVSVNEEEVSIQEPEKVDDFGWFTLDKLPSPLHSALETHIIKTDRKKMLEKYMR